MIKKRRDPVTGRILPALTPAEFNNLIHMIQKETDIIKIYDFLDKRIKDNRTKWDTLKKALKTAQTAH